jgi:Fe-S oxidoreductase
VVLFVDEFADLLDPAVGVATVEVLAAAGAHVTLAPEVCCGRPLYDRGMLDRARGLLLDLLDALAPLVDDGATIVGIEPSCVAVLRDELPAMLPDDARAARVAGATRTLAEHLVAVGWTPPDLTATHGPGAPASPVLVQRHCHEHALRAGHPDADLLTAAGADVAVLDDGCCGMAGAFGFAAATEPTSRAVGESRLLPRVRAAPAGAIVLADGFSCRTQLAHLQDPAAGGRAGPHGPVPAVHLAGLLADALRQEDPGDPHTRQG